MMKTIVNEKLLKVVCDKFGVSVSDYHSETKKKGSTLLVAKWVTFFMVQNAPERSFDLIGVYLEQKPLTCMEYVGEIGFNIRADPRYESDFKEMNEKVSKIYKK